MDLQKKSIRKPKCALLVDQWLPWYSAELETAMHLSFDLERHGYDVEILTPSWHVQKVKGFHVRRFFSTPLLALYLMFKGGDYVFLHAHGPYSTWSLLWSRFFYKTPTLTTAYAGPLFHQGWSLKKAWFRGLYLKNSFKAEISVSESFLDLKNVNKNIEVIPFGVDPEPFDEVQVEKGDRFNALYVGSLRPGKGLEMLLKAVGTLIQNQAFIESSKDFMLHLVGTGPSTNALKHLAETLGIAKYVRFHGSVRHSTLIQLYKSADLFVRPCESDSLSLTLLEACAAGLPLLVSNVGDHKHLVVENVNGHLIDPGNLDEWVFYLERFVTTPHLPSKMGEQSRALIESEFKWENTLKQHIDLYERVQKPDLTLKEPVSPWLERIYYRLSSLQMSRPYKGKKPLKMQLVLNLDLGEEISESFWARFEEWSAALGIPVTRAWRLPDYTLKDIPTLKKVLRNWDKPERVLALPFEHPQLLTLMSEEGFTVLRTSKDPLPSWTGKNTRFELPTLLEAMEVLLPRIHRFRRHYGADSALIVELFPGDFESGSSRPLGSGENFTKLSLQLDQLKEELDLQFIG